MESKALEKLGILKPRRTFGQRLRSFGVKIVVIMILCVCGWGTWTVLRHRAMTPFDKQTSHIESAVVRNDESLFICEHLTVRKVAQVDVWNREIDGRMIATARNYWYRLSIDENWYFKTFIPQVKKCLAKIAPGAPAESIELDTKDLAYANDGADRLQKMNRGHIVVGDAFRWNAAAPNTLRDRQRRRRKESGGMSVLLIDGSADSGAVTRATVYSLNRAQFEKMESWISQAVLRRRPGISVAISADGVELGASEFNVQGILPVSSVYYRESCYAISPWIAVRNGVRHWFLCVQCRHANGVPDRTEEQWKL